MVLYLMDILWQQEERTKRISSGGINRCKFDEHKGNKVNYVVKAGALLTLLNVQKVNITYYSNTSLCFRHEALTLYSSV